MDIIDELWDKYKIKGMVVNGFYQSDIITKKEFTEALGEILSSPVEPEVMEKISEIVKEILQEGFNVAMYGNPFNLEEKVKQEQEKLYDEVVEKYTKILSNFSV